MRTVAQRVGNHSCFKVCSDLASLTTRIRAPFDRLGDASPRSTEICALPGRPGCDAQDLGDLTSRRGRKNFGEIL